MRTMDWFLAAQHQRKYNEENGYPQFAPAYGTCWYCGKNIYEDYEESKGISLESAGSEGITGCPHCHASYVD